VTSPTGFAPGSVIDALLDAVVLRNEAGEVIAANAVALSQVEPVPDAPTISLAASGRRLTAHIWRDTSEETALRARRDLAETRYRTMFDEMPIGFAENDFSGVGALLLGMFASGTLDVRDKVRDEPDFLDALLNAAIIVDMNREALRLFGAANRSDIVGKPVGTVIADREKFLEAIYTSTQPDQTIFSAEMTNRRVDGSAIETLQSVYLPAEKRTDFTTFICEMDISELKRSQRDAFASEARYRNVFEAMPVAFFALDWRAVNARLSQLRSAGVTDLIGHAAHTPGFVEELLVLGRVVDGNETAVRVFGAGNRAGLLGDVARYWPEASRALFLSAVDTSYRGVPRFEAETRMTTLDGREIDVIFTAVTPEGSAETGSIVIGVVDVSERVATRAAVERLQTDLTHAARVSMLGELTASIAHEVNQPLAAIATNGQAGLRWLSRPEIDVEEVRTLAERMVADAYRAADIIGRIRAMAAKRAPERVEAALNPIVEEAALFLRHELQASGVALTLDLAPDLQPIEVDRTQIQQVIVNLAMNAMQAMATVPVEDRGLAIATRRSGEDRLETTIRDSGPGIPPDHLGKLFESFFTTKEGGLGIGLPICRSIVEAHGGSITATNNPDAGATFSFTLAIGVR
jgi:signal transduction histidine kinase